MRINLIITKPILVFLICFISLFIFAAQEKFWDPVQMKYKVQLKQLDKMQPKAIESLRRRMILDYKFQLKRAQLDKKNELIQDYEAKIKALENYNEGKSFEKNENGEKKEKRISIAQVMENINIKNNNAFEAMLANTSWSLSGNSIITFDKDAKILLNGGAGSKISYTIKNPINKIIVIELKKTKLVVQFDAEFKRLTYFNEKFPKKIMKGMRH